MSKWQGYADNMKGSGDGKYVNLKDKEQITFTIMGDPGEQYLKFPDGGGKPTQVKAGTTGAQHKIGIPIYDTKQKAARFLQLTVNTFKDLAALVAELGEERIFRVSRTGSGLTDTKYTVTSIDRMDDALKAEVAKATPVELDEAGFSPILVQSFERQAGDEDPIPF